MKYRSVEKLQKEKINVSVKYDVYCFLFKDAMDEILFEEYNFKALCRSTGKSLHTITASAMGVVMNFSLW